ncbi:MAG: hypothetical protein ACRDPW_06860 [Mycobacteriales bacterium]
MEDANPWKYRHILDTQMKALQPGNRNALFRVTSFLVVTLVVLALGFGIGQFFDYGKDDRNANRGSFKAAGDFNKDHAGHNMKENAIAAKDDMVGGLAASDQGYTLRPENTNLMACTRQVFRFRIAGPDGNPLHTYSTERDERMRLAIVRHDFSGYQQTDPQLDPSSGVWSTPISLVDGGRWRILVDFVVRTNHNNKVPLKLGIDITTEMVHALRAFPSPSTTSVADGVTIDMNGKPKAGEKVRLEFTSTRSGTPVPLESYLDAYGHLVMFRQGDFGYMHGAPEERQADNKVAFSLTVPNPGIYVAYLHFKSDGRVHTAEFALRVQ